MKSGEEGSTLVEMAFSCTILLSVMIGIFQVSLMLYCYHFISYAAREGARYAIVRGSNSCLTAGISTSTISNCNQTGSGTAIVNYVGSLNFPGIDWSKCTTAKPCVIVTWPGGNNNPGSPVQVQVKYPYTLMVPWVKPISVNMSSTSQMLITN
jgi:Flp pilus assembly protein TadG